MIKLSSLKLINGKYGVFSLVCGSLFLSLCLVKKQLKKGYYKDDNLLTEIGNKIRTCRITKGFSIEYLANESEVDYSQLSRMELGKVNFSISILFKIATNLGINAKDLLP